MFNIERIKIRFGKKWQFSARGVRIPQVIIGIIILVVFTPIVEKLF